MKIALISVDETIAMLGLRELAAVLKQAGHTVKLLSMQGYVHEPFFNERQLAIYKDYIADCQLVGVSCMAINKRKARQIAGCAREMGKTTIWGGVYATLSPEDCCQLADYVCIGEGEGAMLDLVAALEKSEPATGIQNLAFFNPQTNQMSVNPVRPYIRNFDEQPFPDHDIEHQHLLMEEKLYSIADYLNQTTAQSGRSLYIYLYSSKGCPFSCTYCSNSTLNELYHLEKTKVRFKSVDRIIAEIKILIKIYPQFKKIWIVDDSFFTRNIAELTDFKEKYCQITDLPLDFFVAPNMVSAEKFEALLPIDISLIRVGIQSGSPNTLKNIYNRHIEVQSIQNTNKILTEINQKHHCNINAVYQIILNNPYEEAADLMQTIKLLQSLKPPFYLSTFFLIYFPGSRLYDRALEDRIVSANQDNSDQEFLAENHENHLTREAKNLYLNSIIFWMHGRVDKNYIGCVPRGLAPLLISKPMIRFHSRFRNLVIKYNRIAQKRQVTLTEFLNSFTAENNRKDKVITHD